VSAAATAAGYLYAHNRLPAAGRPAAGHNSSQARAERPHHAAPSQASRRWGPRLEPRFEPDFALRHDEPQPVKEARTPRIEYRKRRVYPVAA
jgi:hypothetical protein